MATRPAETRSIMITGTSSGIGWAAARDMGARGWRVFATVRTPGDAARVGALPGVTALLMDYGRPESIAAAADRVLAETGGRLDALYNNGAYGQLGALEDVTPDQLREVFEVNVVGWHDLTRRVIPGMRAAGHGRIVNCSSVLGFVAMPWRGAYNAAKHAVEGLTDTLRLELAGSGIFVSTIQPGPIATRFVDSAMQRFRDSMPVDGSAHAAEYRHRLDPAVAGRASPFTRPPEDVVACLVHACESPRPRPYYRVTTLTRGAALARRLLPARLLIALLSRAAAAER